MSAGRYVEICKRTFANIEVEQASQTSEVRGQTRHATCDLVDQTMSSSNLHSFSKLATIDLYCSILFVYDVALYT